MANFSERLRELRLERGITQDDLALAIGLSRSTIAGYESPSKRREPEFNTTKKIADYFSVSVDYLIGTSDDKYSLEQITSYNDDNCDTSFGERLRSLREARRITQTELAKMIDLSPDTIMVYEQNKSIPDSSILENISKFFGVAEDYLMCKTNKHNGMTDEEKKRHYELDKILNEKKVLFCGEPLTLEEKEAVVSVIKVLKQKVKDRDK